jgi:hypothetical protein
MNMNFAVDDDLDERPTVQVVSNLHTKALQLSSDQSRPEIAVGYLSVAILHRLTLILIVTTFPAKQIHSPRCLEAALAWMSLRLTTTGRKARF